MLNFYRKEGLEQRPDAPLTLPLSPAGSGWGEGESSRMPNCFCVILVVPFVVEKFDLSKNSLPGIDWEKTISLYRKESLLKKGAGFNERDLERERIADTLTAMSDELMAAVKSSAGQDNLPEIFREGLKKIRALKESLTEPFKIAVVGAQGTGNPPSSTFWSASQL